MPGPMRQPFAKLHPDIQRAIGKLYMTIYQHHPEWSGCQITLEDPRKEELPTVDVRYTMKPHSGDRIIFEGDVTRILRDRDY